MAAVSGQAAQFGYKLESAYGTPVTVDTFLPFTPGEGLDSMPERVENDDIIAGRLVQTSDQWTVGKEVNSGSVGGRFYDQDMDDLLKAMMGSESSGTYTPGEALPSMTAQIGVPGTGGTVHPKTFTGAKVGSWDIAWAEGDGLVTWSTDLVAQKCVFHRTVTDGVTTNGDATITSSTAAFSVNDIGKPISGTGIPAGATIASINSATSAELSANATADGTGVTFTIGIALASASYTSGLKPYTFVDTTVSLAGTTTGVKVRSGNVSGDNALAAARFFAGSRYCQEPLTAGLRTYGGSLELEFVDETIIRYFRRGTEIAIVLTFAGVASTLTVTMNARLDGELVKVSGRDLLTQPVPYKCVASGADSTAISMTLA